MKKQEFSCEFGGRQLTAIFSDLADQANGSVMVRYGHTLVMATAVMGHKDREGIDFFPLTVDYEERFYSVGKILGGQFVKREGKPSDEAVLAGRVIDRTIRPLFNHQVRRDVQVVITLLSKDEDNDPDVPAVIAASLALATSNIPWGGPVGAVRFGLVQDEKDNLVLNPTYGARENGELDLLICGKENKICMIEAEAKEVPENVAAKALHMAVEEITKLENWQKNIVKEIGKTKVVLEFPSLPAEAKDLFEKEVRPKLKEAIYTGHIGKTNINVLKEEWLNKFVEKFGEDAHKGLADELYEEAVNDLLHTEAIKNDTRPDGRKLNEIRPLFAEAGGLSPVVHGSGIFYRGGTHILSVLTLSGPKDSQVIDGVEFEGKKHFMHHYNFPPFSTGETGRVGGLNRRAIGHGALAEKSLRGILPERDVFPYTIRLVSEAMASNGSTSMGSVCASCLALMDGGVPIKRPVAGMAMGLMWQTDEAYKILTDIQGPEDHHGDMDFKVAGTTEGITGIQLDIKVDGINPKILIEAMDHAKAARLQIIEVITKAIPTPRPTLQPSAPRMASTQIDPEKIGMVIGSGGKTIKKIMETTETTIEIEDDGSIFITGKTDGGITRAKQIIDDMTHEYKAGERFTGEVTRLMDFGAFVKIGYDAEGLVHVSEIAPFRIEKVSDYVKLGDKVPVVVKEIDEKGRINLSIKQADPSFIKQK